MKSDQKALDEAIAEATTLGITLGELIARRIGEAFEPLDAHGPFERGGYVPEDALARHGGCEYILPHETAADCSKKFHASSSALGDVVPLVYAAQRFHQPPCSMADPTPLEARKVAEDEIAKVLDWPRHWIALLLDQLLDKGKWTLADARRVLAEAKWRL